MLTKKEIEQTKAYFENRKNWNGGAGMIIPKFMADLFKENGITEHYTVNEMVKKNDKKP